MSVANPANFVCQETFHADNTTSCLRYPKLKRCEKEGKKNNLTFLCVGANTIAIGASNPKPLPDKIAMSVYQCTMESCPTEAPAKEKKGGGDTTGASPSTTEGSNTAAASMTNRNLSYSALFVLGLIASQLLVL
ncbi:hypothetical protein BGZ70_008053 [Mortierella alpina]|uniref:Uncharacterized protein n=1 Tax=Mortierella alpina TaxID=64518 RepID=A0A9P6M607_MORAP|nr:hypothetical protein BGZ70_008053 [Mortierella alpina]